MLAWVLNLGFAASAAEAAIEEVATTGGYLPPKRKKRKPQKPEWQKRDEEAREFAAYLERLYSDITGDKPETEGEKELAREVVKTVRPYTQGRPRRPPPAVKIDFQALARSAEAAERLLELAERKRDDEEAAITLLLM